MCILETIDCLPCFQSLDSHFIHLHWIESFWKQDIWMKCEYINSVTSLCNETSRFIENKIMSHNCRLARDWQHLWQVPYRKIIRLFFMYSFGRISFLFLEISRLHLGTSFCLTEMYSFMMFPFRRKTRSERNHELFPHVDSSVFPSAVF